MINEYLISVDPSMRSTGIHLFKNELPIFHKIITTDGIESFEGEKLITHVTGDIIQILQTLTYKNVDMVIEGLSFMSASAHKDLIDGLHWGIRTAFYQTYPNGNIGVVPVTMWRNHFSTKDEQKQAKVKYKKDALKQLMVEKLPADRRENYEKYIASNKIKKDSIFDLTDSYWIGKYRYFCENK